MSDSSKDNDLLRELGPPEKTINWTVVCEREGRQFTTTCEYLVLATGHHAQPKIPQFPGEDNFLGLLIFANSLTSKRNSNIF